MNLLIIQIKLNILNTQTIMCTKNQKIASIIYDTTGNAMHFITVPFTDSFVICRQHIAEIAVDFEITNQS